MDNTVESQSKTVCAQQLTRRQKAIVVGTLLGDGCLERRATGVRLRLEQSSVQEEYLLWKYDELKSVITGRPRMVRYYHKKHNQFYESVRVATHTTKLLEPYWQHFYCKEGKIVPKDIGLLLKAPLSLAVWFMDDGYKRNDCNALRLSTDSFDQVGQERLRDALKINFGINSAMHKKGKWWNIYIPRSSSRQFVHLIAPYILPPLQYKITLAP